MYSAENTETSKGKRPLEGLNHGMPDEPLSLESPPLEIYKSDTSII